MKNKIKFIFIATLMYPGVAAFSQITFQKTFGGLVDDVPADMIIASDGNYVMAGTSFSLTSLYYDPHLVKFDVNGNVLWEHIYHAPKAEASYSVIETSDHGFLIALSTNSFDSALTTQEVCLIRTDSMGNFLWSSAYRYAIGELPYKVIETKDHGFLITGVTTPPGGPGVSFVNALVIKTDAAGTMQWMKSYGGPDNDYFISVKQLDDDGYLFFGNTKSFPGPVHKLLLTRTDSLGTVKWSKIYSAAINEVGYKILAVNDSEYVFSGSTGSSGNIDAFLMTTDTAGVFKWAKSYGGPLLDVVSNGVMLNNKGYLLSGLTLSFIFGNSFGDIYAMQTDSAGNLIWSRHYGGIGPEDSYSILPTPGNGAMIIGYESSFGAGDEEFYLIKTDSLGASNCHDGIAATVVSSYTTSDSVVALTVTSGGIPTYELIFADTFSIHADTLCMTISSTEEINQADNSFIVRPNPSSGNFEILFPGNASASEIYLYDSYGRLIEKRLHNPGSSEYFNKNLPGGLYVLKVLMNGYFQNRKILISRK